MYMFNMNRCYRGPSEAPIVPAIVPPIQIKYVHSNVSYQKATNQKYDRRGHESPSGTLESAPPSYSCQGSCNSSI